MARKSFTEHPSFMRAGELANSALNEALMSMGCELRDLNNLEDQANRVVDDLTRILLKALDAKQIRSRQAA